MSAVFSGDMCTGNRTEALALLSHARQAIVLNSGDKLSYHTICKMG
jgi:hypothetical protein